ncbi:MAG TPA: ATP synthase F1 subunit epsilon [Chthoniobacteraceae bacterium]|jgi:F-type H+-transporting ATPase subunit epsilon
MATLKLEIVTPEKVAYSADVDSVLLPAIEGEMGVLPMHIPLMTMIKPGELVVRKGAELTYLAVGEGFVTVNQTSVKVLTDMAISWEHIDESAAEAAVKRAEEAMANKHELGGEEAVAVQAALAKSLAQLNVKRRRRIG